MSDEKQNVAEQASAVANVSVEKLKKVVTVVETVTNSLKAQVEAYEDLTLNVAAKQTELDNLEKKYAEEERTRKVDLDLKIKENEEASVKEILTRHGKVAITRAENDQFSKLKSDFSKEVATIEEAARIRYEEKLSSEKLVVALEFKSKEAENIATINAQKSTIAALESQVRTLNDQISAERAARVEEAKARGQNQVTVNTGK